VQRRERSGGDVQRRERCAGEEGERVQERGGLTFRMGGWRERGGAERERGEGELCVGGNGGEMEDHDMGRDLQGRGRQP
jgi:hypothetical protein